MPAHVKVPHVFRALFSAARATGWLRSLPSGIGRYRWIHPVHHRAPAPVVVVVKEEDTVVEQVFANLLRVLGHLAQLPQHSDCDVDGSNIRVSECCLLGRLAGAETHHATVGSLHEKLSLVIAL